MVTYPTSSLTALIALAGAPLKPTAFNRGKSGRSSPIYATSSSVIPNLLQSVKRERVNGQVETMQNIFLEIDLNSLNRDNLKQVIKMVSPSIEQERGD